MFQGFSQEAIDFLWGIRLNNERPWFLAHKQDYEQFVLAPMKELGAEVFDEFAKLCPKMSLKLHISRIYRDARRLFGRVLFADGPRRGLHPGRHCSACVDFRDDGDARQGCGC